jgi:hypothetical protein
VIDPVCGALTQSGPEVCLGPIARVGVSKVFTARGAADPDGSIVRYEWDLDGNGSYERDTGSTPEVATKFLSSADHGIRLRVTDDDGATGSAAMEVKVSPAACESLVQFERVRATAVCFRREQEKGTALKPGDITYVSDGPVNVNGVTVAPAQGRHVSIQLERLFADGGRIGGDHRIVSKLRVRSSKAVATIGWGDDDVVLDEGAINWELRDDRLQHVGLPGGAELGGMPVSGLDDGIALPSRGRARAGLWLRLPAEFGAPTSKEPEVLAVSNVTGLSDLGVEGELSPVGELDRKSVV